MSEEKTADMSGPRSFEERVFARFDALDRRLDRFEERLARSEEKAYDTKPIWERALAEIAETRAEMREGFARLNERLQDFDVRLDRVESVVNATRSEMLTLRADFKEYRGPLKEPA